LGNPGFDESYDEDYDSDDDLLLDDGEEDNTAEKLSEWARRMRKLSGSGWHYPPRWVPPLSL